MMTSAGRPVSSGTTGDGSTVQTSVGEQTVVLVTGGLGFIGSHLVEALIDRGCRVMVLDNLSTGRIENLRGVEGNDSLQIRVGSVNDRPVVEELVETADIVFHLAAVVGAAHVVEKPVETINTNLFGSGEIFAAATRFRRPVVFASTSELYGHSEEVPFHENSPIWIGAPGVRRWSYATAKAAAEQIALAHAGQDDLRVVIPRLFNTIGERQRARYGMVVPRFVDQVLNHQPITVYGDGRQTRCFVDVLDVVAALIALAECREADGQVVNLGSTGEISILELAELVRDLAREVGAQSNGIHFVPYAEIYGPGFEDPPRRLPSTERIERLTGWRPRMDLEDTIRRVILERRALRDDCRG